MSFKIAICDDDKLFRETLFEQVKEILQSNEINAEIHTFDTVKRLDSSIKIDGTSFDLLILDIYLDLDESNGFNYAKEMIELGNDIPVVFISVTRDYVLEGYDVNALGYLVKPVEREALERVLLKAYRNSNKSRLIIKKSSETLSILVDEILYIEVIEKRIYVHSSNGAVQEITTSLKSITDKLPSDQFVQCHRSFLVSIPSIESINRHYVTVVNGDKIPVGRKYYSGVQEKLMDWATFK